MDTLKIIGCWAACIAGGALIGSLLGGNGWVVGVFAGFTLPIAWALWSVACAANG